MVRLAEHIRAFTIAEVSWPFIEPARLVELERWLDHGACEVHLLDYYFKHFPQDLNYLPGGPSSFVDLASGVHIHDIAKPFVSDDLSIWYKGREELMPAELELMQSHVHKGAEMVKQYQKVFGVRVPDIIMDVIKFHHEKIDGTGPYRKMGDDSPYWVRLVAIVDQLVSRLEPRSYHNESYSLETALAEIEKDAGVKYDGEILAKLRSILEPNIDLLDIRLSWWED